MLCVCLPNHHLVTTSKLGMLFSSASSLQHGIRWLQVNYMEAGHDSAGWSYCQTPGLKPDSVQAAAIEQQAHSWGSSAGKGCMWRRRAWINHGHLDSLQVCSDLGLRVKPLLLSALSCSNEHDRWLTSLALRPLHRRGHPVHLQTSRVFITSAKHLADSCCAS